MNIFLIEFTLYSYEIKSEWRISDRNSVAKNIELHTCYFAD